ncbi:hypothetical protein QJS66_11710 [Kocuria rhizophila]|nr:hypothetical protein QJS66_11710 [Kocuria rhizophila]
MPADAVISSDPAPGSSIIRDSAVKLQVSSGKVTVPDVVGRSRGRRRERPALRGRAAQTPTWRSATEDAGDRERCSHNPPAGSSVSQGSTITLTVRRSRTVPTPSQPPGGGPRSPTAPAETATTSSRSPPRRSPRAGPRPRAAAAADKSAGRLHRRTVLHPATVASPEAAPAGARRNGRRS